MGYFHAKTIDAQFVELPILDDEFDQVDAQAIDSIEGLVIYDALGRITNHVTTFKDEVYDDCTI